jgi:hypothetical protein
LTSFAARERLRNLEDDDPTFFKELCGGKFDLPDSSTTLPKDAINEDDDFADVDDSDIPAGAITQ